MEIDLADMLDGLDAIAAEYDDEDADEAVDEENLAEVKDLLRHGEEGIENVSFSGRPPDDTKEDAAEDVGDPPEDVHKDLSESDESMIPDETRDEEKEIGEDSSGNNSSLDLKMYAEKAVGNLQPFRETFTEIEMLARAGLF